MAEGGAWVVKLGGSLDEAGTLADWVRLLLESPGAPRVVVPGGGVYADLVRRQQARAGFDDGTAHAMALLAMDQYGLRIIALAPQRLRAARSGAELRAGLEAGGTPVWLPSIWADAEPALARSWQVTSDALALWLAAQLGAGGVVLVKSAEVGQGVSSAREAARRGWIDQACAGMLTSLSCPVWLAGPAGRAALPDLLAGRTAAALRLR